MDWLSVTKIDNVCRLRVCSGAYQNNTLPIYISEFNFKRTSHGVESPRTLVVPLGLLIEPDRSNEKILHVLNVVLELFSQLFWIPV